MQANSPSLSSKADLRDRHHTVVIALNRDATQTLELRVQPPGAHAKPTEWLLLHTLPVTASLSRVLRRLLEVEMHVLEDVGEVIQQEVASDVDGEASSGTATAEGTAVAAECEVGAKSTSELVRDAEPPTGVATSHLEREEALDGTSSTQLSVSGRAVPSYGIVSRQLSHSQQQQQQHACVEIVRVGYVLSEIHAFCLLIRCTTTQYAEAMKRRMERGAALGVAAPVEYVLPHGLLTTHAATSGAEDDDGEDALLSSHLTVSSAAVRVPLEIAVVWAATDTPAAMHKPEDASTAAGPSPSQAALTAPSSPSTTPAQRLRSLRTPASCQRTPVLGPSLAAGSPFGDLAASSFATVMPTGDGAVAADTEGEGSMAFSGSGKPHLASPDAPQCITSAPLSPASIGSPATAITTAALCCNSGIGLHSAQQTPSLLRRDDLCTICQVEPLQAHPCVVALCQHVFHLRCYSKLPQQSADCPLCRFSLYDLLNDAKCEVCHTYVDLWSCLTCGFVGCGQGRLNHQRLHSESTGHSCAMQSATNRIYNYHTCLFLHQQVAMELGDFDAAAAAEGGGGGAAPSGGAWGQEEFNVHSAWDVITEHEDVELQVALNESKDEAVSDFYARVLQTLLQEQRQWFESGAQSHYRQQQQHRGRMPSQSTTSRNPLFSTHASSLTNVLLPAQRTGPLSSGSTLTAARAALAREEYVGRSQVVRAYVDATRSLWSHADRLVALMLTRRQRAYTELQDRIALQKYANSGRGQSIVSLRERVTETEAKGLREQAAKEKQLADLRARLTAALEGV